VVVATATAIERDQQRIFPPTAIDFIDDKVGKLVRANRASSVLVGAGKLGFHNTIADCVSNESG